MAALVVIADRTHTQRDSSDTGHKPYNFSGNGLNMSREPFDLRTTLGNHKQHSLAIGTGGDPELALGKLPT